MAKNQTSPRVGIIGSGYGLIVLNIRLTWGKVLRGCARPSNLSGSSDTITSLYGNKILLLEEHGTPAPFRIETRNINTYPGCACDIPGIFYSFSFDPHPGSTFFPPQSEIRSYLHSVSDNFGITPHITFNTR